MSNSFVYKNEIISDAKDRLNGDECRKPRETIPKVVYEYKNPTKMLSDLKDVIKMPNDSPGYLNNITEFLHCFKDHLREFQLPRSIFDKYNLSEFFTQKLSTFCDLSPNQEIEATQTITNFPDTPPLNQEVESQINQHIFIVLKCILLLISNNKEFLYASDFIQSNLLNVLNCLFYHDNLKIIRNISKIAYHFIKQNYYQDVYESKLLHSMFSYLRVQFSVMKPSDEQIVTEIHVIEAFTSLFRGSRCAIVAEKHYFDQDSIITLIRGLINLLHRDYPQSYIHFKNPIFRLLSYLACYPPYLHIFFVQNFLPSIYFLTLSMPTIFRSDGFIILSCALTYGEDEKAPKKEEEALKIAHLIEAKKIIEGINKEGCLLLANKWWLQGEIDDLELDYSPIKDVVIQMIDKGNYKDKGDAFFCLFQLLATGIKKIMAPFLDNEFLSQVFEIIDIEDKNVVDGAFVTIDHILRLSQLQGSSSLIISEECLEVMKDFLEYFDNEHSNLLLEKIYHFLEMKNVDFQGDNI